MSLLLSGPMLKLPAAGGGATFTDTFSYTGNLEDEAGWAPVAGYGNYGTKPAADGSDAFIATGANAAWMLEVQETFANDQACEVTVADAGSGAGNQLRLILRLTDEDNYYYVLGQNSNWKTLGKVVAGVNTNLDTGTNSASNGDVIRFEVSGTSLIVKLNGVTILSATDSDHTSGSAALLWTAINATITTPHKYTSFTAEDL